MDALDRMFTAPRGALDKKPPHGSPCTRCGLCCEATLCPLAKHVFKRATVKPGMAVAGPCPALSYDENGSVCGLVANPVAYVMGRTLAVGAAEMTKAAAHLIGSTTGCDARFNGEPTNTAFYRQLEEHDRRTASLTARSKRIWGIP